MQDAVEIIDDFEELSPVDTVAERWGAAVASGFTVVPNSLLRAQSELGLTAVDVVVLLNLLVHWWHRDRLPFPRTNAIAKRTGLSNRTIQRSLKELQGKGLVRKLRGADDRTRYELDGLQKALSSYATRDPWYRPHLIRATPGETRNSEAPEGHPSPSAKAPLS